MVSNRTPAERRLVEIIEDATRRHAAAFARLDHQEGARSGLTLSTCEANFVNLLRLHGPLSPGDLGRLSGLTSSGTITGVVDRLERAGYVHRTRCVEDRRKVTISLNRERLEPVETARAERVQSILDGYDADQLATISDFLRRLADVESQAANPLAD